MRAALLSAGATLLVAAPSAQAAWGPAVALADDARVEHRAPAIARNAAGDAVLAFVRAPAGAPPGSGRVVVAERSGASGAWAVERLTSGPGVGAPAVRNRRAPQRPRMRSTSSSTGARTT